MKNYLFILSAIAAIVTVAACASKKKSDAPKEASATKILILYYSQTGATKAVAEELQRQLGADIESIEAEEPYDGDYQQTIERGKKEMEEGITPKVKPLKANLAEYDIVFIGTPIWFGTYAQPIAGLLQEHDFTGKKIVPFCTFGSGGLEATANKLKEALPHAEILNGYGVRNARIAAAPKEINRFLKENGYVEGGVEALPNYSEQEAVSEEDKAIFDAACGDYKFPLGTPVTVGKRTTADGTDYKYAVKSTGRNGEETMLTIYVTVQQDAKPEFTQVVR